jgi:outer membrane biosynthesis protein TonB
MLTTKQLRELISKHNKLSKITIPARATRPQLIKLIEGQGYKVFEEQGKIVGGPKRIIKPDTPSKKAEPKKEAPKKKAEPKKAEPKKAEPKKAAPAKKAAPKKERRQTYYIEAHMLADQEEDMMKSDGWKVYDTTPYKTFLKKLMTKKEADYDIVWDSKDAFADYSVGKSL